MGKNTFKMMILLTFGVSLLFAAPGCEVKRGGVIIGSPAPSPPPQKPGPPPWAPAHGRRAKHTYWYYPSHYVYYDVGRKVYFYIEGDGWRMSAQLPSRIHLAYADHVQIELETEKPFQYFSEHKKKYPPGQLKNKNKNKNPKKT